jgi:hypothetical protein
VHSCFLSIGHSLSSVLLLSPVHQAWSQKFPVLDVLVQVLPYEGLQRRTDWSAHFFWLCVVRSTDTIVNMLPMPPLGLEAGIVIVGVARQANGYLGSISTTCLLVEGHL